MAGAFSIAFSAINSIATHYETICEDAKKAVKFPPENWGPKTAHFQFFRAGAFRVAFSAIKLYCHPLKSTCEDAKKTVKFSPSPPPCTENWGPKIANFQFLINIAGNAIVKAPDILIRN